MILDSDGSPWILDCKDLDCFGSLQILDVEMLHTGGFLWVLDCGGSQWILVEKMLDTGRSLLVPDSAG